MSKLIITAGPNRIDIDGLACIVGYKNILDILGVECYVNISKLNSTCTKSCLEWVPKIENAEITLNDKLILVDVSDKEYLQKYVKLENVVEIYDHHPGYEHYWEEKLGIKSNIQIIGAAATLIYEKAVELGILEKLDKNIIKLLFAAIVSNTFNLKVNITSSRDIKAYNELLQLSGLPSNWYEIYFDELLEGIENDIENAIKDDTKVITLDGYPTFTVGQNELWNSKSFVLDNISVIEKILISYGNPDILYTSPSIGDDKNYLYSNSEWIKEILGKTIGAKFNGNYGETDKLYLRKEILGEMIKLKKLG